VQFLVATFRTVDRGCPAGTRSSLRPLTSEGVAMKQRSGEAGREDAKLRLRVQMRVDEEQCFPTLNHCEPTGPREARPDDRLREAIQNPSAETPWIASSQELLAMTRCGVTRSLHHSHSCRHTFASSRHLSPELCLVASPPIERGRREDRVPAGHPRSTVRKMATRICTAAYRWSRASGLPCAVV